MDEEKKITVPVAEKYTLTVQEAIAYTGIPRDMIYGMIHGNPTAKWHLKVGRRTLIKRELFCRFLDNQHEV